MTDISLIIWAGAILGFLVQYKIRAFPVCLITEGLGVAGIVQANEEFTGGLLNEWTATIIIILMVAVITWSVYNGTQCFGRGRK